MGQLSGQRVKQTKYLTLDPCSYCGRQGGTRDHITPKASGGSDQWSNLTGCCPKCNQKKGIRGLLRFLITIRKKK